MAVSSFSNSGIKSGSKRNKIWDQSAVENSFFSIETVTVGAGGAANIEFTNIPQTYTHLQIRGIGRTARANIEDGLYIRFNSATTGYSDHHLYGSGAAASSFANSGSDTEIETYTMPGNNAASSIFGVAVIDILDYKDTNKFKTLRLIGGFDNNSTNGRVELVSGNWRSTNAITSITLIAGNSTWVQYSSFALYGIKG